MNLKDLLQLYMRVNKISRAELARMIGIPKSVVRRLCEGKPIWSSDVLLVVAWLFADDDIDTMSIEEWVEERRRGKEGE